MINIYISFCLWTFLALILVYFFYTRIWLVYSKIWYYKR
jgi:cytochrome P450